MSLKDAYDEIDRLIVVKDAADQMKEMVADLAREIETELSNIHEGELDGAFESGQEQGRMEVGPERLTDIYELLSANLPEAKIQLSRLIRELGGHV